MQKPAKNKSWFERLFNPSPAAAVQATVEPIPAAQQVQTKAPQPQTKAQAQVTRAQTKAQTQAQVTQAQTKAQARRPPTQPAPAPAPARPKTSAVAPKLTASTTSAPPLPLTSIAKVLVDPSVDTVTLYYHHHVRVLDEQGVSHRVLHYVIKREQLPTYVQTTFGNPSTQLVLAGRVYENAAAAQADVAGTANLVNVIGWPAAKRLTPTSPLIKRIVVKRTQDELTVVLVSRTDGTLATFAARNKSGQVRALSSLHTYGLINVVVDMLSRVHKARLVYGGVDANSILYSSGGLGGITFVLSGHGALGPRTGDGAALGAELKARLSKDNMDVLKAVAPAQAAGPLSSAAQLDLIPFGVLLHRLLLSHVIGAASTGSEPSGAPGAPGTAAAPEGKAMVVALKALVTEVASACLAPDADFDTARTKLVPLLKRFSVEYDKAARVWTVENAENKQGLQQHEASEAANVQAMTLDQVGAIRIAQALAPRVLAPRRGRRPPRRR